MTAMGPIPEFSVEINLESVGGEPCVVNLEAGQDERAALSRRFGLISVDSLSANLSLKWLKPGRILLVPCLSKRTTSTLRSRIFGSRNAI